MKIDDILDTDDYARMAGIIRKLCAELNKLNARHRQACEDNDKLRLIVAKYREDKGEPV